MNLTTFDKIILSDALFCFIGLLAGLVLFKVLMKVGKKQLDDAVNKGEMDEKGRYKDNEK